MKLRAVICAASGKRPMMRRMYLCPLRMRTQATRFWSRSYRISPSSPASPSSVNTITRCRATPCSSRWPVPRATRRKMVLSFVWTAASNLSRSVCHCCLSGAKRIRISWGVPAWTNASVSSLPWARTRSALPFWIISASAIPTIIKNSARWWKRPRAWLMQLRFTARPSSPERIHSITTSRRTKAPSPSQ